MQIALWIFVLVVLIPSYGESLHKHFELVRSRIDDLLGAEQHRERVHTSLPGQRLPVHEVRLQDQQPEEV